MTAPEQPEQPEPTPGLAGWVEGPVFADVYSGVMPLLVGPFPGGLPDAMRWIAEHLGDVAAHRHRYRWASDPLAAALRVDRHTPELPDQPLVTALAGALAEQHDPSEEDPVAEAWRLLLDEHRAWPVVLAPGECWEGDCVHRDQAAEQTAEQTAEQNLDDPAGCRAARSSRVLCRRCTPVLGPGPDQGAPVPGCLIAWPCPVLRGIADELGVNVDEVPYLPRRVGDQDHEQLPFPPATGPVQPGQPGGPR